MADSTALKRQNLDGVVFETPSSAEKKQKHEKSVAEDRKNGSDPPPLLPEKSKNGSGPSPEKKIDNLAKDFDYWSLTPNDEGYAEFHYGELEDCGGVDEIMPDGASKEQRPDFVKLFGAYDRQMYNSDGFDCYDYPCGSLGTGIQPIQIQNLDAHKTEKIMELANHAIQLYNEEECNVYKYKALKIEKANYELTSYFQYYMTVKVLNITLGSLVETFQIRAARDMDDSDRKLVYSCKPKVKGFDVDTYPSDAKAAIYTPYLGFEKEADMLMELAKHAIDDYNNVETNVHKYKVSSIEKVNYISTESCREFFITIKVKNLTLRTPLQTFQIHAYKGPHGENVVILCRRKP
uniref:Cystatin domain-containing protein n=1 Tax=Solanum tuberosum TaxID=4113 RepID=M1A001_SOLTU